MNVDPNILAAIVSVTLTAVIGFIVARAGKRHDARAQAEAALIGIGPQIIKEQNLRINQQDERINLLGREIDKLRERERDCQEQLDSANNRIALLESRIDNHTLEFRSPKEGASILIVDDSPEFARTIERTLNFEGLISFHVTSGSDALRYLRQYDFKLIIMDIVLNGELDGVATALRMRDEGFNLPIIAVTGHEKILDNARVLEAGFVTVLIKSQFRYQDLIKTVKENLSER